MAINIGGVAESMPPLKPADRPPAVQQTQEAPTTGTQQNQNTTIVAPLFEHGEGRGAMGCVVVSPPIFLSEEEAIQVIKEELSKYGVKLGPGGELKDVVVKMRATNMFAFLAPKGEKERFKDPKPLSVDTIDQDKNIVIEFVSRDDFAKLHENRGMGCTAREYNIKGVAENLTKESAGKGKQTRYLGVFYDPMNLSQAEWKKKEKEKKVYRRQISKDEAKKLLRQQASDFANWLGEQGVEVTKQEEQEKQETKEEKKE
ncbi:MAG: hypothetical protein PVH19_10215 [Planctomycetia bacterium]